MADPLRDPPLLLFPQFFQGVAGATAVSAGISMSA
jgi:hypothetical protein